MPLIKPTHIHQSPGIDEPIAMLRDLNKNQKFETDEIFTYTKDHLGSVRDITNNNAELIQRYDYSSYGITKLEKDPANPTYKFIENNYTYTAQDFDIETGLIRSGVRYYDSQSGRWISPDPIGFLGLDVNFYRAFENNPTRFSDPSGMIVVDRTGGRIPPNVANSVTFKILAADPNITVFFVNKNMPGYYGLTTPLRPAYIVEINFALHENPAELSDTFADELSHVVSEAYSPIKMSESSDHKFIKPLINYDINSTQVPTSVSCPRRPQ